MTGYLLDTTVISELTMRRPSAKVMAWLRTAAECYLSVLTIGEFERGVWLCRWSTHSRGHAATHGLTNVTRTTVDFTDFGVPVVDPFARAADRVMNPGTGLRGRQ